MTKKGRHLFPGKIGYAAPGDGPPHFFRTGPCLVLKSKFGHDSGIEKWLLLPRRTVGVCVALSAWSVESILLVWEHVFFSLSSFHFISYEWRNDVWRSQRHSFVKEWCCGLVRRLLIWKVFRDSGNGVKWLFELVGQSGDLPVVSCSFYL